MCFINRHIYGFFHRGSHLKQTSGTIFTMCSHTFILFWLRKAFVGVETYQLSFRVFICNSFSNWNNYCNVCEIRARFSTSKIRNIPIDLHNRKKIIPKNTSCLSFSGKSFPFYSYFCVIYRYVCLSLCTWMDSWMLFHSIKQTFLCSDANMISHNTLKWGWSWHVSSKSPVLGRYINKNYQ